MEEIHCWSSELHRAASKGDSAALQQLLQEGHPPDTPGGQMCWLRGASEFNTRTPLHYCARGGHLHCLRLLLRHGANPNSRDSDGYTPLHYTCQIHHPGNDIGDTVLHCLQSLIAFGGDTKARTSAGNTPLDIARRQKNSVCANELQRQGTQCKSLLVLSRNTVSAMIHAQHLQPASKLWIPESLKGYLLFEDVLTEWNTQ